MISTLTRAKFPNSALGIEKNSISAVALQGSRKRLDIRQAATVPLPDGVLEPSFLETNIKSPADFDAAVREALEIAGLLGQKRWSVTLPSNSARTAILALETEPASGNERSEVLDWKAEQSFGVPAADMRLSMEKISPDRERRSRYFVTAVKLAVIDEFESRLESMGLKCGLILPRAIGEANWLMEGPTMGDSLLISATNDGFTALLLRGGEPAVVRSVTCSPNEIDDEIYRLVMFYNDRFAASGTASDLDRLMLVGGGFEHDRIQNVASEALGRDVRLVSANDVGLTLPDSSLSFDDLAAPAGVAALAF